LILCPIRSRLTGSLKAHLPGAEVYGRIPRAARPGRVASRDYGQVSLARRILGFDWSLSNHGIDLCRFVRTRLDGVLKSPNSLGQALPELRQLLRAEQKQCDCQNHQQVPWLEYTFDHRFPSWEKTECSARIFPRLYRAHQRKKSGHCLLDREYLASKHGLGRRNAA
jgi:hypothetical protein